MSGKSGETWTNSAAAQARVIARLRILTEDRLPETYLLLQRREVSRAACLPVA